MSTADAKQRYWKATLRLLWVFLFLWVLLAFFFPTIWADSLNEYYLGGFPLGFWFAMQGSIIGFVVLLFLYTWLMNRIEQTYKDQTP